MADDLSDYYKKQNKKKRDCWKEEEIFPDRYYSRLGRSSGGILLNLFPILDNG